DINDLPAIGSADVSRFLERVGQIGVSAAPARLVPTMGVANDNVRATNTRKAPLPKPERESLAARIVRNPAGRVMDGREAHLTLLVWHEYHRGYADVEALAWQAWSQFAETADLKR